MTKEHRDPADALRRAWDTLRLTALQKIVDETICDLQHIEPSALLGRALTGLEQRPERNPIRAALEACSEELREESGMAGAQERRRLQSHVVRENMLQQPLEWTVAFREAFEKYRQAAGSSLDRSLGAS